jgi:cytochrome c-type biogenesis protein CcmH/NrfG
MAERQPDVTDSPGVRVCLAMVVQDSADALPSLIDSLDGVIDQWLVVDAGSLDGTVELVPKLLRHLPGRLERRPWINPAHNRTEVLELASELTEPSHLLVLDPHMVVEARRDFRSQLAAADAQRLMVAVRRPLFEVRQPLLLRTGPRWSYEGTAYTRLVSEVPVASQPFDALVVTEHQPGNNAAAALADDLESLVVHMQREPADPDLAFHLAENYRALGRADEAVAAYLECLEMSPSPDLTFHCVLTLGDLAAAAGDYSGAAWRFQEAMQIDPYRAEPFHRLGRLLNEQARWEAARVWLEHGATLAPAQHGLVIERWVEHWGLSFELAVAQWWTGRRDLADATFRELLGRPEVPDAYRRACEHNLALMPS